MRWIGSWMCAAVLLAAGCAGAPKEPADPHPRVRIDTSMGAITVELDGVRAPVTVNNFLAYARDKRYDGTIFHRVIAGFVIQGGGYDAQFNDRPRRPPIKLEAGNGLSNLRGTVAMARTDAPDSADCEFYINLGDNLMLDPQRGVRGREYGYAVFGRVIDGMETVDRIAAAPTHALGGTPDVPVQTVLINSVRVLPAPR